MRSKKGDMQLSCMENGDMVTDPLEKSLAVHLSNSCAKAWGLRKWRCKCTDSLCLMKILSLFVSQTLSTFLVRRIKLHKLLVVNKSSRFKDYLLTQIVALEALECGQR